MKGKTFSASGSRFKVQGSKYRAQSAERRAKSRSVQGSKFKVQGSKQCGFKATKEEEPALRTAPELKFSKWDEINTGAMKTEGLKDGETERRRDLETKRLRDKFFS
jgi:hypothetical protein